MVPVLLFEILTSFGAGHSASSRLGRHLLLTSEGKEREQKQQMTLFQLQMDGDFCELRFFHFDFQKVPP